MMNTYVLICYLKSKRTNQSAQVNIILNPEGDDVVTDDFHGVNTNTNDEYVCPNLLFKACQEVLGPFSEICDTFSTIYSTDTIQILSKRY